MKRRLILALLLVIASVVSFGGWYYWGPARAPEGQPALVEISPQSLEQLRAAFNDAAGHPRIIALLSPT